jgi:cytochrome c oxidase assembly factor CtaG/putative copper export protein
VKDLYLVAIIVAIGLLYSMGFLLPEKRGRLGSQALRIKSLALLASVIWLVCTVGGVFVELANLLGGGLLDAFNSAGISFLTSTSIGRDYLFQIIMGIIAILLIVRSKKVGAIYFALAATMLAELIPLFQSHAASAGNHGLAIGSLIFHVGAVSLWMGGVIGLIVISARERSASISRFSALALWAAIITGISGLLNAWTRLNFIAGWQTRYGLLVIVKIALFGILVAFGAKHRRSIASNRTIASNLQGATQVFRLLVNESLIMIFAVSIGAWLSTSQPPISSSALIAAGDPSISITGISAPPAPTLGRILTAYSPDGTMLGLLLLATALYIYGVVVLTRRGDKWPLGRTVAFAVSISLVDFATSGGVGVYSHFAFSYHMVGHMILGMIAPIGFVLSAPITLALRTLPIGRNAEERGLRGTLITIIHSKYSVIITNPVLALALFDGSLFVLYMTPIFGKLMQSHSGHLFMDLHFLLAGYLFFYVIIGIDPNPRKIPYIARIIVLFAAMSIHAFFSVALLSTTTLLDGGYFASLHRLWNTNLLADQHTGAALGWIMGEIPILVALIATFIQWVRDDSREAKRIDRAADRAAAMGEDDELARYNKYLASLAKGDQAHPE